MMDRIKRAFALVRASWEVLRADRELVLLPVLSALACIGLVGLLFVGLFADDLDVIRAGGTLSPPDLFEWFLMALATYALSYVVIFFNVALICAADERMSGGDPTVGSAISDAWNHARGIAPWALLSVLVSTVLRAVADRGGILGEIAARLVGVAWGLVTYLILPVLVFEGLTVREAVVRSKDLFKRTWGEGITGEVGMSVVTFVLVLLALPFLLLIGGGGQPELIVTAVALGVAWCIAVAIVMTALNAIFRVALYRFATGGEPPAAFAHIDFAGVFPERGAAAAS